MVLELTKEQAEALRAAGDEPVRVVDDQGQTVFRISRASRRLGRPATLADWNDTPEKDAALGDAGTRLTGETLADEPWE
ncbi:MAG: hypothetical protein AAGD32_08060 [Planctomycetota bacterium]